MREIHPNQPGMQLYPGNLASGSITGRGGTFYRQLACFAFEPQGCPDAPHQPTFSTTVLRPRQRCRMIIRYRFSAGG